MKRSRLITILFFVTLLMFTISAPVQGKSIVEKPASPSHVTFSLVDQFGGGSYGVDVAGDYVYAAIGPRFVVLQQNEGGRLHMVSETAPFDDMLHRVVVAGPYAYAAEYRYIGWDRDIGKLHIIDISQPDRIRVVKTMVGLLALDMVVSSNHLFVAAQDGLHIFDLSQTPDLTEVAFIEKTGYAIIVQNNLVYLLEWNGGLNVFDITDPSEPMLLSNYHWGLSQAWDMILDFPYLVIANGYYGLTIIDVSDPAHPAKIETMSTGSHAIAVAQSRDHVFVSSGGRLHVFAKLTGGKLQKVDDSLWLPITTREMTVQSNRLFAAAGGPAWDGGGNLGGLFVFDISTPQSPSRIQWRSNVSHARSAVLLDSNLYLAGDEGIYILEMSDHQFVRQSAYFHTRSTESVDVYQQNQKRYAFLAQGWAGLEIVDVTDSNTPSSVARFTPQPSSNISQVIVDGAYAYLGVSGSQTPLLVLDISSPDNPLQIASFQAPTRSGHVSLAKQGDTIYLVNGDTDMYIIDVTTPSQPTQLGILMIYDGSSLREIAVEADRAFIATGERGVRVIDIADPAAPRVLNSIPLPAFANHIQVNDGLMVTSHFMEGSMQGRIYLTDISDPLQPATLSYADTAGEPFQALFYENDLFIPDGPGGVRWYQRLDLNHQLFQPYTLLPR